MMYTVKTMNYHHDLRRAHWYTILAGMLYNIVNQLHVWNISVGTVRIFFIIKSRIPC